MPEYLAPGLYVEELDSGSKPIEGVGTNTAAFIGYAKSGEFNKPIFVDSWTKFCTLYGQDDSILAPLSDETGLSTVELLQAQRLSKSKMLDFARETLDAQRKTGADVKSWTDFVKANKVSQDPSPYLEDSFLAYAVRGFYLNGGNRCYVIRVARPKDLELFQHKSARPQLASPVHAAFDLGPFVVKALKGGSTGNDIAVEVTHVEGSADGFTVKITEGDKSEPFGTAAKPLTPDSFAEAISKGPARSKIVEVITTATETKNRPAARTFNLIGGADALATAKLPPPLQAEIARVTPEDFVGDEAKRSGVRGLGEIDDINMICAPDLMAGSYERSSNPGTDPGPEVLVIDDKKIQEVTAVQSLMIAYAEQAGDRMVILDSIPGQTAQQIRDQVLASPFSSDHGQAAYYYPWIKVVDEVHSRPGKPVPKLIPPSGHMAGVWARVVSNRGVHKAPANEAVLGVVDLETQVTQGEQAILNPEGINVIRSFPGTGIRVWGARTLATRGNPSWKYVNVRRLFNYLEKSMSRNLQWTVFEPNDEDLWGRVRRTISAFLYTEWKEGHLFGTIPEEAYYVKCDRETNPQEMIDLGRMYVEVGVNPVKPAEFVIIRIGQWTGGGETSEG
jgi:phage tail sheath protein FI